MQQLSVRSELNHPASVIRLPQGLTVIHHRLPATSVVVADIWVKAGAAVESEQWSGMAHFLEHMIFKGSSRLEVGMFDRLIENTGAIANAATSYDYAHYFLTTAAAYFEENLTHLADILLDATISEVEFEREREVVLEELRSSLDDPDWIAFQNLCQNIYQQHPYGRSILGEEHLLFQHTPQQMRDFHQHHYQAQNMTVVIVGGIEQEQAVSIVNQAFNPIKSNSIVTLPNTLPKARIATAQPQVITLPRLQEARLLMGWLGPGVEDMTTAFGLDLWSIIIGSGRCSRLVQELREERQWVYEIESSFSLQRDSSLLTISAWLEPDKIEVVKQVIGDRLLQLQQQPPTETELRRAQRILINDYIFSTESPGQMAGLYGYYNTIATHQLAISYPQQIQSLTVEKLQAIAKQYLSPDLCSTTIVKPSNIQH